MKIINPGDEDYHCHSSNYSDGLNSIDELVRFAGEIGLKRLAITDHSQAALDAHKIPKKTWGAISKRWRNVHNFVEVIFGVEADLLNERGDICDQIDNVPSDWLILSAHPGVYTGDPPEITEGYLKAIGRNASHLKMIGHLCSRDFSKHIDIEKVVRTANLYGIPLEFNCANLLNKKTDLEKLFLLLQSADSLYVNSDAHNLYELKEARKIGFAYLKEQGFLK